MKDEIYRNWIMPPSVLWGWGGRVGIRIVVERNGTISSIEDVSSSGKAALDRAARNALLGSRLLPLPSDYGPDQLVIDMSFDYGPPQAASR
jgi:TonB family protein